jgi:hypothetical protein
VRAEDQLKAEEEEEAQEIIQGLAEGRDDEQAEEQAVEVLPAAARHFQHVVATMHSVLDGRELDFEQMAELSRDEREAFEVLTQVVHARGRRGGFIYAEERLQQLNQVLAVLQPALSIGSAPGIEELRGELAIVIDEVAELRERLINLEAAEEEFEPRELAQQAAGDKDDEDDDDEDEDDASGVVPEPGAPPRPSILSKGAAAPDKVPSPITLTGSPAAPDKPSPPTTLTGSPEAPAFEPPPSTLSDEPAAPPAGAAPASEGKRGRKVT